LSKLYRDRRRARLGIIREYAPFGHQAPQPPRGSIAKPNGSARSCEEPDSTMVGTSSTGSAGISWWWFSRHSFARLAMNVTISALQLHRSM
jgi:hypothetical protein